MKRSKEKQQFLQSGKIGIVDTAQTGLDQFRHKWLLHQDEAQRYMLWEVRDEKENVEI